MKVKPEARIERIENEPGISGHRVVAADGTSVYKTLIYFSYAEAKAYAENTGLKVVRAKCG
jgi:hypothetical protein